MTNACTMRCQIFIMNWMSKIFSEFSMKILWSVRLIEMRPEMTQKHMDTSIVQEIQLCKRSTLIKWVMYDSSNENLLICNNPVSFKACCYFTCSVQTIMACHILVLHHKKAKSEEDSVEAAKWGMCDIGSYSERLQMALTTDKDTRNKETVDIQWWLTLLSDSMPKHGISDYIQHLNCIIPCFLISCDDNFLWFRSCSFCGPAFAVLLEAWVSICMLGNELSIGWEQLRWLLKLCQKYLIAHFGAVQGQGSHTGDMTM